MGKLVAVMGLARSGKDTTANYLVRNHHLVRVALADPMKRFCAEVFDFSDAQLHGDQRDEPDLRYPRLTWREGSDHDTSVEVTKYLTPRYALQTLGTEWGRDCYDRVWIDYGIRVARLVLAGHHYDAARGVSPAPIHGRQPVAGVVFSDLRYRNEYDAFKAAGAIMVRIHRDDVMGLMGVPGHASEKDQHGMSDDMFDVVLSNVASFDHLHWQIEEKLVPLLKENT